jgi:hypothetical protein
MLENATYTFGEHLIDHGASLDTEVKYNKNGTIRSIILGRTRTVAAKKIKNIFSHEGVGPEEHFAEEKYRLNYEGRTIEIVIDRYTTRVGGKIVKSVWVSDFQSLKELIHPERYKNKF